MNLLKDAKIYKILVTVFTALVVLALILTAITGCAASTAAEESVETTTETTPDFIVERAEADTGVGAAIYIITDAKTGDRYMFVKAGYGGGLTKMED